MKTKNEKKPTARKRLLDIEYQVEELERESFAGMDPGREVVALFAMRNTLTTMIEDGVVKEMDESKAREIVIRIRTRIETLRRLHPQNKQA